MSIPILWQDPFSIGRSSLFISQYFSSHDENEKKFILKECGINVKFPNSLFNYAKFLKVLKSYNLNLKVNIWINFQSASSKPHTSIDHTTIVNLLFKLFVESGATLHKLDLDFIYYEINPEIFFSLGRNELFFSRLQDLSLYLDDILLTLDIVNVNILLKILAKDVTKLSALKIYANYSDHRPQFLHALICIIKSQEQLKQFSLICGNYPIESYGVISALERQKNSLQEVIIEHCKCRTEFKVLKDCKNLETLRIRECSSEEILEVSLNTLQVTDHLIDASKIVQILKKSGTLLQRLSLVSEDATIREESLLLKTIKSFCPNITYLNISGVEFSTQFLKFIGNLQKLQFLTLWYIYEIENEPEILVIQFAKLLPLTLQYLDLRFSELDIYFDILLNNCYAPLKYLLIDNLDNEKKAKALNEFCTRRRSLNYVGVEKSLNLDDNIKKEVERFVTLIACERIVVNC
ncbi:hypothetical protein F8M41_000767 [Gigaspora margarita]|uniref:Uncharacterized protein n=1 Tax=Gigaspora margarita TaxID=4874 RepID=A0A8H4AZF2_GIGMA|nr:hypothetical protein F8M41_000767 [Gigaspora margarita]